MTAPEETSFEGTTSVVRGVPHCPDCPGGHILQVFVVRDEVGFAVDCHEPVDAPCRFATGCLVTEQCEYHNHTWPEYYDRTTAARLHDGMPIKVEWSTGDECWMWAPAAVPASSVRCKCVVEGSEEPLSGKPHFCAAVTA